MPPAVEYQGESPRINNFTIVARARTYTYIPTRLYRSGNLWNSRARCSRAFFIDRSVVVLRASTESRPTFVRNIEVLLYSYSYYFFRTRERKKASLLRARVFFSSGRGGEGRNFCSFVEKSASTVPAELARSSSRRLARASSPEARAATRIK